MSEACLIALGSNLGDRQGHLRWAQAQLGRLPETRLLRFSSLWETPPERPGDGGAFVNAAALLRSGLSPQELLEHLLRLERRRGRPTQRSRGPRPLDLDIVLFGERALKTPVLTIPHPRFRQRSFVLGPAAEVAPSLRDPLSGQSIRELWTGLGGEAAR